MKHIGQGKSELNKGILVFGNKLTDLQHMSVKEVARLEVFSTLARMDV